MTRTRFCRFLLVLALSFATAASAADGREMLRISGWRLPFNIPVMVEREKNIYGTVFADYDVSIVDMQTGPRLMAALEAGNLDIVQGVGDAAFLVAASAGVRAKIVAVNSRSPKAFAVVSNNRQVRSIADLKGKKVAGLRGSVVHEVFVEALRENGMTEADVEFFPMPVAQAASTLLAGRADAALLVGSEIVRATRSGAVVLADGEGRVHGLSFVVVRTKFAEAHPEIVARFLEMRRDTLQSIEDDPERAIAVASLRTRQEPEDVAAIMGWYDFDSTITPEDVRSMEKTKRYLRESGLIDGDIEIQNLFY